MPVDGNHCGWWTAARPSLRTQRVIAALVILTQGGIAVTGAIVRVTASGLGCPTWPQCFPGSFTPVAVSEVPRIHQAVEFGNRMITFAVVHHRGAGGAGGHPGPATARGAGLRLADAGLDRAAGGDRRHHRAHRLAVVDGGHPSAGVDGDGVAGGAALRQDRRTRRRRVDGHGGPAAALAHRAQRDDAGRGAGGRHPGHRRGPARRRHQPQSDGAAAADRDHHAGACALVAAGGLSGTAGRSRFRAAGGACAPARCCCGWACWCCWCSAQAAVGTVQFFTGVPAALVAVHVAGAAACTAATAALWASMRERTEPKPVQG